MCGGVRSPQSGENRSDIHSQSVRPETVNAQPIPKNQRIKTKVINEKII